MVRQITVRPPIAPPITALSFVEVEKEGEAEDGEAEDGEAEDVDAEDGDAEDGDSEDGDSEDGEAEGNAEDDESENEGVAPDGGEVIEEYTVELELDAGSSDVSTTVVVDREAGPSTELLGTEVELDGAVVVSTTVGV